MIGRMVGATVAYCFGPILIVFGMFATGTVGTILREMVPYITDQRQEWRDE